MFISKYLFQNTYLRKISRIIARRYAEQAVIDTKPYKFHNLANGPTPKATVTKKECLDLFRDMTIIRKLEMKAQALYRQKLIRGFCHLYIGQEACAVGVHAAMRPQDSIVGNYRIHGWAYVVTKDISCVLGEITGRKFGLSKGKGGSMHMYFDNLYGGQAIVGAQTPLGAGVALAHKYTKSGGVSITVYGDGAANQGQLFEAFNMAKIWNLPCLFLCENNRYAMGTSLIRGAGSSDFYKRGDYIPGLWVNGMDVLSIREAAKYALEYCASGKGPLVMELNTYRFVGHSMSDPDTTYRTRDEVKQERQARDPIKEFKEQMIKAQLATEEDFKKIDDQVTKDVNTAAALAVKEDDLPVPDLTGDIYKNNIDKQMRGVDPWSPWKTFNRPLEERPCTNVKSENVKK